MHTFLKFRNIICNRKLIFELFIQFVTVAMHIDFIKAMDEKTDPWNNEVLLFQDDYGNTFIDMKSFVKINPLAWQINQSIQEEQEVDLSNANCETTKIKTVIRHESIFKCRYCNRILYSNRTLIKHIKDSHPAEKAYICFWQGCSYAAANSSSLAKHRAKHRRQNKKNKIKR